MVSGSGITDAALSLCRGVVRLGAHTEHSSLALTVQAISDIIWL